MAWFALTLILLTPQVSDSVPAAPPPVSLIAKPSPSHPPVLPPGCSNRLQRVAGENGMTLRPGERLVTDRNAGLHVQTAEPRVQMHYLLDRTVGECPIPVIAVETLPDADRAIGREIGRR